MNAKEAYNKICSEYKERPYVLSCREYKGYFGFSLSPKRINGETFIGNLFTLVNKKTGKVVNAERDEIREYTGDDIWVPVKLNEYDSIKHSQSNEETAMVCIDNYGNLVTYDDGFSTYELYHHGIKGQEHGVRNGPPYPLGRNQHSAAEKRAGWTKSLASIAKATGKGVARGAKAIGKGAVKAGKGTKRALIHINLYPKKLMTKEDIDRKIERLKQEDALKHAMGKLNRQDKLNEKLKNKEAVRQALTEGAKKAIPLVLQETLKSYIIPAWKTRDQRREAEETAERERQEHEAQERERQRTEARETRERERNERREARETRERERRTERERADSERRERQQRQREERERNRADIRARQADARRQAEEMARERRETRQRERAEIDRARAEAREAARRRRQEERRSRFP